MDIRYFEEYGITAGITQAPDRSDVRRREMAEELKQGKKFILFPEGGYKENNRNIVEEFKAGSFKVAQMAKVPIVPVALVDSYKVYNSDDHIGPTKTFVYYLKPIHSDEYKNMRTKEIAAMVRQRIVDTIEQHFNDITCKS